MTILAIPVDGVQLCFQIPERALEHARVSREEIDKALADLARARSLGLLETTYPYRLKFWNPTHLDALGYELPPVVESAESPEAGRAPGS